MKLKTGSFALGIAIALTSVQAYTQTATSNKDTLIKQVLEVSGTKKQIEQLPDFIKSSLAQRKDKTDPKIFGHISSAMLESFSVTKVSANFETTFGKYMDERSLVEVLRWY